MFLISLGGWSIVWGHKARAFEKLENALSLLLSSAGLCLTPDQAAFQSLAMPQCKAKPLLQGMV